MLSAKEIVLEYVFPLLGILIGNCMFSAPFQDLRKAVKRGYLGDLNPTPWSFMLGNCCGWVTYSILRQNLWIFFGNCPGFCLSIWLNLGAAKLQYQTFRTMELKTGLIAYLKKTDQETPSDVIPGDQENQQDRTGESIDEQDKEDNNPGPREYERISNQLISQTSNAPAPHERLVMGMVFLWVGLISLISFSDFADNTNELIIGLAVNLNLVFFYGAPLSTILQVIKTKNSASIHIWTMITNTANGTFWGAYGLAILDPFVYVPNGLGTALGVIQIFLVLTFPRKGETVEASLEKKEALRPTTSPTEELAGPEHASDRGAP